jgi:hypothetical protein
MNAPDRRSETGYRQRRHQKPAIDGGIKPASGGTPLAVIAIDRAAPRCTVGQPPAHRRKEGPTIAFAQHRHEFGRNSGGGLGLV